jgi:hypothetical protein
MNAGVRLLRPRLVLNLSTLHVDYVKNIDRDLSILLATARNPVANRQIVPSINHRRQSQQRQNRKLNHSFHHFSRSWVYRDIYSNGHSTGLSDARSSAIASRVRKESTDKCIVTDERLAVDKRIAVEERPFRAA